MLNSSRIALTTLVALLPLTAVFSSGCDTDDGNGTVTLEIIGNYNDGFSDHAITETTWTMAGMGVFHIAAYDNDKDFLIAENDANNAYNPSLWSRMDWAYSGEELFYCQIAFDAADQNAATAATGADRSALATTGCGGYPWSKLTQK